jgi:hypothetical protein
MSRELGVCLKTALPDTLDPQNEADWRQIRGWLDEHSRVTLSPEDSADGPSVVFDGVEWGHSRLRIVVPQEEIDDANLASFETPGGWRITRRIDASILGRIGWWRRLTRRTLFGSDATARTLRDLYCRLGRGAADAWDEPFAVSDKERAVLVDQWNARNRMEWASFEPLNTSLTTVVRAATDAAWTNRGIGFVVERDGRVQHFFEHFGEDEPAIAYAELEGAVRMGEKIGAETPRPDLLLLALDSTNAKSWIESGVATDPCAMAKLARLDAVTAQGMRVFVVYVPTGDMVADSVSRGGEVDERCLCATRKLWDLAEMQANGVWRCAGEKTGGVPTVCTLREK